MTSIIYLAWGRPQRPRANLIQTLHTVESLVECGATVRLYLPPLPRGFDLHRFFGEMGIHQPLDLRGASSLHRRWGGWPFAMLHRHQLLRSDVVYTRVPELSRVLSRSRIPHFLEIHDTDTLIRRDQLFALVDDARSGVIQGLVAITAAAAEALAASGVPRERVHVLPSGVSLQAFAAVPPLAAERLRAPRAVYVGRISRDRGLDVFEELAASGLPVRLVGPSDDEPNRDVANLEVRPAVPHRDVPHCYVDAELALMPYQTDLRHAASISPIKLFEAMAAGRLVVAADLPPIREVVTHRVNALLVPPHDLAAWTDAVAWVRENPDEALTLAETGRRHAARYTWRARAERLLEITGASPRMV